MADEEKETRIAPIDGPILLAARSKACVCSRSLSRIAGSNPDRDMDAFLLWALGVVRYKSLRRADLSSRGILLAQYVSLNNQVHQ